MIRININDKHDYELEVNEAVFTLGNEDHRPDIVKISPTEYHMLLNNKSYRLVITEAENVKHYFLEVNGNLYKIAVKDNFDLLLDKLGLDYGAGNKVHDMKAPMPGMVIDILVEPGTEVKKDTPLIILEAMKMENVLKSPGDGTIEKILIQKRDAVEKGQPLIIFK